MPIIFSSLTLIDCYLMSKELSISYSILAILRRSLQTIHPVRYKGGTGTFYEQMLGKMG